MISTENMLTLAHVREIYELPFTTLIFRAQSIHHQHHDPSVVMMCALSSIKTGGCPEDCAYCPQSSRSETFVEAEALMATEEILKDARHAKAGGAVRFCMGAAWRSVRDGRQFDSVLETVSGVKALGMEVCCTLGMLTDEQARRLKAAGCDVYNHNLDTSREFYSSIITTRTYDDRLQTLERVRDAGMAVCSGGILGLGEKIEDRLKLLFELASMRPQPESVPINALVAVDGTPLAGRPPVDPIEFVRIVATARILMPRTMVRLSAGRASMSDEMQALCFLAGANSIFAGDRLLTTPNADLDNDYVLLKKLRMRPTGEGKQQPSDNSKQHDHEHPLRDDGTWAHSCTGDGHCAEKT
ncbi:MAG: biotin synthase BioB [Nibricoccus sp.]